MATELRSRPQPQPAASAASATNPNDSKEVQAMNARLNDRRRQRREARLGGSSSNNKTIQHNNNGGSSSSSGGGHSYRNRKRFETVKIIRVAFLTCGTLTAIWIMGTIYFAYSLLPSQTSGAAASLRTLQSAAAAASNKNKNKELIDMRDLTATLAFDNPDGGVWKQGWNVEPVPVDAEQHPLTVFVVPHSHCDPGWIQTFDAYFQSQGMYRTKSVVFVFVLLVEYIYYE